MTDCTIGVDISKAFFDAHNLDNGNAAQFDNNAKGFAAFIRWLPKNAVERIVYEPTGKYHHGFEATLASRGFTLCRVNPLHARHFARALGVYAKSDRVDARILAIMGDALKPEPCTVASQKMRDLKALQVARAALIKDRTAAKNRAKSLGFSLLKRQNKRRLKQIKEDRAAIEKTMREIIMGDAKLARMFEIMCSIPGMSQITAATLIVEIPELGMLEAKQAASLAGLAPFVRQSGKWSGKSFIGAGRKFLREALYMPALVATRYNPDMKIMYQRLIEKGKPPKLAITAIMRKLIVLANALIKQDRKWTRNTA